MFADKMCCTDRLPCCASEALDGHFEAGWGKHNSSLAVGNIVWDEYLMSFVYDKMVQDEDAGAQYGLKIGSRR